MADDIITINDAALRATLAQRIRALRNPAPLMAAIALDVHGGVEDVLAAEGMPKWRGLSDVTKDRRRLVKKWPGKMLQVRGELANSIQPDSGDDYAVVATNLKKARTLHFGAKMGEFGRYSQLRVRKYAEGDFRRKAGTIKGFPIPWGDIPARPFMVITPQARGSIIERASKWIAGQ